ncbi:hypothetical protein OH807_40975 [Kitasatospora sp. NBC_01560]|uniref:hypothetical protein n=1 Tax=Kitasatospora sp. NBC_01560 TaxID=2975965 RepID=UPI0038706314
MAVVIAVLVAGGSGLHKIPTADRSVVVDGRAAISRVDTTNPAGAEEYEISYLLLPARVESSVAVDSESSRLQAKGWRSPTPDSDGGVTLVSPSGDTLVYVVLAKEFSKNSSGDSTVALTLEKMGDDVRRNPNGLVVELQRVTH